MTLQSRLRLRLRAIDAQIEHRTRSLKRLKADREYVERRLHETELQDAR